MTPDELKSIPKGEFVVMKTGSHPMRTRLRLFLDWGITFGEPYQTPEHGQRKVYYAGRQELEEAIKDRFLLGSAQATDGPTVQQMPFEKQSDDPASVIPPGSKPMATRVKKPHSSESADESG